jgi:Secretion system C-terminal sorting domain
MLNITTKLIPLGLLLMATAAVAQTPMTMQLPTKPKVVVKTVQNSHPGFNSGVVGCFCYNGLLDYVDGDANNSGYTFWNGSSGNYTAWSPILYINNKYTAADTGTSPFTSTKANIYTANEVVVAYDTMWDNYAYLNTGLGFAPINAHYGVQIDTIWAILGYHNTSGANDTLIFSVCGVTAAGMPNNFPIFSIDTEVIAAHNHTVLPGTSLDSNFEVGFVPKASINIPFSALTAWYFCVHATVHGSKMDTLGIAYYSAFKVSGGHAYSDSITSMGNANGANPVIATDGNILSNSYVTGLYWFNSSDWGGNGMQTTFPIETPASHAGEWVNSGGSGFYYLQPSGTSGFVYYPSIQNIGIILSVNYYNREGVQNINASGLSVAQNYPNPFNKETTISYSLTKASAVIFTVYDVTGRVITTNNYGNVAAGKYNINLSANTFSPGIYFYSFNVNGSVVTKKMVITE